MFREIALGPRAGGKQLRVIGSILVVISLTGCGGGGGGDDDGAGDSGPPVDPRFARLDAYEAQRLRVLGNPGAGIAGLPQTDAAMVPATGSTSFTGGATIRVEAASPIVLYGDATLNIDFGSAELTGELDRFFGTVSNGNVVNYSGEIRVEANAVAQDMAVEYSGALSGGGETLALDGTADGVFLGNTAQALTLSDLTAEAVVGGTPTDATFVVITEATGPPE